MIWYIITKPFIIKLLVSVFTPVFKTHKLVPTLYFLKANKWGQFDYVFENVEIIILMFRILLLLLELQASLAYEVMFAINCGSFSYTMISTKYFNYTVVYWPHIQDTYFEGLASAPETKSVIPESIAHQSDRDLIKTHRTTAQGYDLFSYRPILTDPGYYLAIITMI